MKTLKLFLLLIAIIATCGASDEDDRRGVPGEYSRKLDIVFENLVLKADGSYLFRNRYCLGSEQETGSWLVRDGVVILSPKNRSNEAKKGLTHFLILSPGGDVALRVLDDEIESADDEDAPQIFRQEKKKAD
jgi:hypothetical protein